MNLPYYLSLAGFLILPPLLLWIRFKYRTPWWQVALLISVGGWVLVNASVYFKFEYLAELVQQHPNPPDELRERVTADGAQRVFTFLFGWLYALIYSAPFLLIYGAVFKRRERRNPPEHIPWK